jgi:hypothetical protein
MLNLTNAGSMTDGTYILIDYSGTLNGSVSNIAMGATPSGYTYSLVNNTPNKSIDLVVTAAVPEPGARVLMVLTALLLSGRSWSRPKRREPVPYDRNWNFL